MTFRLWPQSLFGRLMAASIVALLLAQVVSLVMIARERERFILQGSVREWSRRVAEVTTLLQGMDDTERAAMITRLTERPWRFGHRPPDVVMFRDGLVAAPDGDPAGVPPPGIDDPMPPGRPGPRRESGPPRADGSAQADGPGRADGPSQAERPLQAEGPLRAEGSQGVPDGTRMPRRLDAPAAASAPSEPRGMRRADAPPGSATESLGMRRADGPQGSADEPLGARGAGEPSGPTEDPRHPDDEARALRGGHRPPVPMGPPHEGNRTLILRATSYPAVVPFTQGGDFEPAFAEQLHKDLGPEFGVEVSHTADPSKGAIPIGGPLFSEVRDSGADFYDAKIKFPDGYTAVFRVTRYARGAPLPRGLFMYVALLVIVMSVALFVVARSITRPLSELARAADSVGRNLRQPKIAEGGAREIRNAARAFNTMQDRMQRYLDSRSRVLAAMSHDLKTPLTRLRLQVEMLEDPVAQGKLGRQLDEMESMVHGALALFRGLDDNEAFTAIDVNEMLATLQSEFAEMSAPVAIQGHATRSILGKPQALRRCLTNLIANAVKFGSQATVVVEDGAALVIRIRDDGPGIPEDELERVFEPFYRLESSRNRDTGGSGLGLSIARDLIQAHGGSLVLQNLPVRGLEAIVTLPRA